MAGKVVLFCCVVVAAALWVQAAPQEDKLDSLDVDGILSNDRLMKSYIQCMLDAGDGKCTTEGKEVKSRIPALVKTGCNECTPSQLERAVKTLKLITEKYPAEWAKLKAKFDPTGEYTKKHAETWKERGVNF